MVMFCSFLLDSVLIRPVGELLQRHLVKLCRLDQLSGIMQSDLNHRNSSHAHLYCNFNFSCLFSRIMKIKSPIWLSPISYNFNNITTFGIFDFAFIIVLAHVNNINVVLVHEYKRRI